MGFTKLDKVLHSVIKNLESPLKLQEAHLFELWKNRVDPEVQKHAVPERLYGKRLYVRVSEPVWAHELTVNHKTKILNLLQQEVGKQNLEDIWFHVGRDRVKKYG